jgi:hypothetical protein
MTTRNLSCQVSQNLLVMQSSNVVGIICPLVGIGLTDLPKTWGAMASPVAPLINKMMNLRHFYVK